jgi:hypothetical protein
MDPYASRAKPMMPCSKVAPKKAHVHLDGGIYMIEPLFGCCAANVF